MLPIVVVGTPLPLLEPPFPPLRETPLEPPFTGFGVGVDGAPRVEPGACPGPEDPVGGTGTREPGAGVDELPLPVPLPLPKLDPEVAPFADDCCAGAAAGAPDVELDVVVDGADDPWTAPATCIPPFTTRTTPSRRR